MVSTEWCGSVGFERFTICGLLLNSIFACRILNAGLLSAESDGSTRGMENQKLERRRRVEFFFAGYRLQGVMAGNARNISPYCYLQAIVICCLYKCIYLVFQIYR